MQPVQDLTEKIAASILVVDGEDLAGLARIHEHLKQLPEAIAADASVEAGTRGAAQTAAGAAMELVEKIMLREVKDASAALITVSEEVAKLQEIVSGAGAQAPAPQVLTNELKADDLPMIAEFIAEATAHLEAAEGHLLELGNDPHNKDGIDAIFRGFHTIKGVAGFLNLQQIAQLTHGAENLLDLARQEKLVLEGARLDLVLTTVDATKVMIGELEKAAKNGAAPPPYPPLNELLAALKESANGTKNGSDPVSAKRNEMGLKMVPRRGGFGTNCTGKRKLRCCGGWSGGPVRRNGESHDGTIGRADQHGRRAGDRGVDGDAGDRAFVPDEPETRAECGAPREAHA